MAEEFGDLDYQLNQLKSGNDPYKSTDWGALGLELGGLGTTGGDDGMGIASDQSSTLAPSLQAPEPGFGETVFDATVEGAWVGGAAGCVVGALPGSLIGSIFGGGPPGAAAGGLAGCVDVGLNGMISGAVLGGAGAALDYWLRH